MSNSLGATTACALSCVVWVMPAAPLGREGGAQRRPAFEWVYYFKTPFSRRYFCAPGCMGIGMPCMANSSLMSRAA